ncbi:MAG: Fic family protein [Gammaproteobacteria bacterium]|jgi:hypothetical protein
MDLPQNIAAALERVKAVTSKRGAEIIQSQEIKRADRELLLRTNWLQEIMKGWYMLVRPDIAMGDSAAWYANFWDFLRVYLSERFGDDYCLSAESSLDLYVKTPTIPKQVIVIVPKGGSNHYNLLYDTSLLIYADEKNFPETKNHVNGLQVMPLAFSLCKVAPSYFKKNPENAEIALRLIKTPDELSKTIIKYNFKHAANRLVGAYQFLEKDDFVNVISRDLNAVGIIAKPENPFVQPKPFVSRSRIHSPYAARIEILWQETREDIIKVFPKSPGLSKNIKEYLHQVDEIYKDDAYNSLSIEGYKVTSELIEKVKNNQWNPDLILDDQDTRNALAARGYYEAFLSVKQSVEKILKGGDAGQVLAQDLQGWYQKLFLPSVQAGIISAEQLIGYRNDRVHIRGSRHVPPPKDAVVDSMESLFNCIKHESSAAVRAVLGHYLFVFIHPYMDGNGRMARFLMNVMFASGGYSWTVIESVNRGTYMSALKVADEERDLNLFTKFILSEMEKCQLKIDYDK